MTSMRSIVCIIPVLLLSFLGGCTSSDLLTKRPFHCQPHREPWNVVDIQGIWFGVGETAWRKDVTCFFVFDRNGTGYCEEKFTFRSSFRGSPLSSTSAESALRWDFEWGLNDTSECLIGKITRIPKDLPEMVDRRGMVFAEFPIILSMDRLPGYSNIARIVFRDPNSIVGESAIIERISADSSLQTVTVDPSVWSRLEHLKTEMNDERLRVMQKRRRRGIPML